MLRRIHVTNSVGRAADVGMLDVPHETSPRLYLGESPVQFRRYLASTEAGLHTALQARLGETYTDALIEGDPEIDREQVGRALGQSVAVYLDGEGKPLHSTPQFVEVIMGPDEIERERRDVRDVPSNVHRDLPLRWTGKKIPIRDAVRRYCFRRTIQLHHVDALTFDYLQAMARTLFEEQVVVLVGAGESGTDPLLFESNGKPYRGFLSGRIDGASPGRFKLLLHLSDMELRRPPEKPPAEPREPAPREVVHADAQAPARLEAPAADAPKAAPPDPPAAPAKPAPSKAPARASAKSPPPAPPPDHAEQHGPATVASPTPVVSKPTPKPTGRKK